MRTISHRKLRDEISQVLRQVEAGERLRVTVGGRPVADLVPISGFRRSFIPRDEVSRLLERAPLDAGFLRDVEAATGGTIDEL